jgi:hypothetical protein
MITMTAFEETWPAVGQYIEYIIYDSCAMEVASGIGTVTEKPTKDLFLIDGEWLFGEEDVWQEVSAEVYLNDIRARISNLEDQIYELREMERRIEGK